MLNIYVGEMANSLTQVKSYFNNVLEDKYLETDFAKKVVKEIDNSDLINKNLVISPVIGSIPPSMISGGSKALIILNFTDEIIPLYLMGENCYPILANISKDKDVTVTTDSTVRFFELSNNNLDKIHILNDDSYVYTDKELVRKCVELGV